MWKRFKCLMVNRTQHFTFDIVSMKNAKQTFKIGSPWCFQTWLKAGLTSEYVWIKTQYAAFHWKTSPPQTTCMHNTTLQGQAPLLSYIRDRAAIPPQSIYLLPICKAFDTHDKCHAWRATQWSYIQWLTVCIYCTFQSVFFWGPLCSPVVHTSCESSGDVQGTCREHDTSSPPFGAWSCSRCLSSESKMVKNEPG